MRRRRNPNRRAKRKNEANVTVAQKYARVKLAVKLADAGVSLVAAVLFLTTGASRALAGRAAALTDSGALQWLFYFGAIAGGLFLLGLPLGYFSGYTLEHRYDLSNQTRRAWLGELLKGVALTVVLGAPILLGFRFLLAVSGEYWGLASAAGMFALTVVLVRLAPTLLMPLFFKFKPVERPELLASLQTICQRAGFALEGVYQFDMSKNTKKANAAFTGLGSTKRIILGDTLLTNFPLEEIEAVVAHEAGHFRHAHLVKGILFNGVALVALFLAAQWAYGALAPRLGYGPAGDLAGVPLIFLLLGIASFLSQPISNAISRAFERQADDYAFCDQGPAPMGAALRRLGAQNLAETDPPRVVEFLFHSHPAISKRIAAAEAFAGRKAPPPSPPAA
jgi:STE24 endopeptidase